jgi:two-component system nitrate/nitrite response regulator NarL
MGQDEPVHTLAVCDTEPVAIEGLRSLLRSAAGMSVVAAETTLADGLDAVRELRPNLAVVDKAFGTQAVLDLLHTVRHGALETCVIVWSTSFTEVEALRLLQAGAAGVVRKTSSLDTLVACLTSVARGSQWMGEDIIREGGLAPRQRTPLLTVRELEVMQLVERGMRNRDIAESLGIQVGTVKIHLKHIFEKTGVRGRYGLALSGLRDKGLRTTLLV